MKIEELLSPTIRTVQKRPFIDKNKVVFNASDRGQAIAEAWDKLGLLREGISIDDASEVFRGGATEFKSGLPERIGVRTFAIAPVLPEDIIHNFGLSYEASEKLGTGVNLLAGYNLSDYNVPKAEIVGMLHGYGDFLYWEHEDEEGLYLAGKCYQEQFDTGLYMIDKFNKENPDYELSFFEPISHMLLSATQIEMDVLPLDITTEDRTFRATRFIVLPPKNGEVIFAEYDAYNGYRYYHHAIVDDDRADLGFGIRFRVRKKI